MKNTNVLISGASIGGPALAYWLASYGFNVTVVEKSPELRSGGQAVDFKGDTHLLVLERTGILEEVRRQQTGGTDQHIVDANGRELAVIPGSFTGGDLEIKRGDLARILYDISAKAGAQYVFGDSITSLTETGGGVHVTFERGAPRTYDLVVGADGIHSNVRRLAFGPESDYVTHLGHYYALADLPERFEGPGQMYNEPGRMLATGGPKAGAMFVFAAGELTYDRHSAADMKRVLRENCRGMGWRSAEVLAAAEDVYLDSISQVRLDHYAKGRVVLIGDAAYGNTLGGFGSGLAMVAAYVLAGELASAGGDHRTAYQAYEDAFRDYAKIARNGNAGRYLAPATRRGIRMRNWIFKYRFLLAAMTKMGDKAATDIELKDYSSLV
ncbi:FAD-dependent monooxygenase [Nonomuraea endophytica]|uniref:2-polyprenyl-6-methoxyphenol hydroxylase-like FAD-dependent oxidoreductase n=1 Tax=Nonomuraea endophytica TaxID=714136 RepID=A0A7W8EDJ9_9ACTN|nr:FAD-dependent monooxygenase [Nonomuraea endophytica]MBB5075473.1 2-polyprenyl-6-methoxyphenol hydroxylase-like FAD-dependent oxidoreductase [Nonomuraea endophytica]